MIKNEFFVLTNGVKIPKVGLGTWQSPNEDAYKATLFALQNGYRHIDSAYVYQNEDGVGRAIKDSKIKREDIFVTTKLPSDIKTYDGTIKYFNQSLKNLGLDYLDLYLIHAPWPWSNVGQDCRSGNIEAWKAMIDLYNKGLIKSIGVSNFSVDDLKNIIDATGFVPHVNQIRFFVGNRQDNIYDFCIKNNILVEAYSPLATGEMLQYDVLDELVKKYNKSKAQICIRYCIDKDTLPLPKSLHENRILENIDLDFKLDKEDVDYLDSLGHVASTRPFRS